LELIGFLHFYSFFLLSVEEETYEETEAQAPQDEAKIQVGDVRSCEKIADHLIL